VDRLIHKKILKILKKNQKTRRWSDRIQVVQTEGDKVVRFQMNKK